jgi:6-pyruvoyltetrahydropterin/6-carboxytetrahydropterin synthase
MVIKMRLEIDGWKAGLRFSGCHIIPEHGVCNRLHGHTYTIHTRIHGTLNEQGFVLDFGIIKDILRNIVTELDHRLLVPERNSHLKIVNRDPLELSVEGKQYIIPNEDVVFLQIQSATAEHLAEYILNRVIETMTIPGNIEKIEIGLDEGWGQGAWVSKDFVSY